MISYKIEIADIIHSFTGIPRNDILQVISEPPPDIEGDLSIPCFTFARLLKKSPRQIAEELAGGIQLPGRYDKVIALNGYLNFFLDSTIIAKETLTLIRRGNNAYGNSERGKGKTVTIDFSSPNMGKELAFHHLRGTMLGNALSRIYQKNGFLVVRINHLGDWGTSYGKLILMYLREGLPVQEDYLSQLTIEKLNELYQSFAKDCQSQPELEDEARAVFQKLESGDSEYGKMWKAFREITLKELKRLYSLLNVEFDEFTGESFFIPHADDIIKELQSKDLVSSSQGTKIVDLNDYDLPPLMLKKSDGTTLYATRDLCAAIYRKEHYDFYKNLYVVDNGQSLHFRQFFKVLELMNYAWASDCRHIPFGLILTKSENGKWEKGKTRIGRVSLLKDVIKSATEKILEIINEKNPDLRNKKEISRKIAIGALVFNDLKNKRLNDVNFDWDSVLSFEGDTGPYVINAYVRLCSILRKGGERKNQEIEDILNKGTPDFSKLGEQETRDLIRSLSQFPEKIQVALEKDEPSVLAQYSLLLAEKIHRFIHACRVLGSPEELERLFLVDASRIVLRNTFELIGLPVVEEM